MGVPADGGEKYLLPDAVTIPGTFAEGYMFFYVGISIIKSLASQA